MRTDRSGLHSGGYTPTPGKGMDTLHPQPPWANTCENNTFPQLCRRSVMIVQCGEIKRSKETSPDK